MRNSALEHMQRSLELFEEARRLIPGGVSSPVRAFGSVGGTPPFIDRGSGAMLFDADGNDYIDYVMSWGALPLGHAHPDVVSAIARQAAHGTSFGAPTVLETELTRLIIERMPAIEMLRFVSSGTEAVMSAVRLARAATGGVAVVKFDGCYHGHADPLLVAAGSGLATFGLPDSAGVPAASVGNTISLPYNDLSAVEQLFERRRDIAAVIVEPVAGNMGLVLPAPAFLEGLRNLTTAHGALLIFDEVMTGARVGYGGAQQLYGISPDLTTLGKVIGGGLPVGAYGGPRDIMELVAPSGPVYQAGTLSGNPLAMAAGIATLRALDASAYARLHALSRRLAEGLAAIGSRTGVPIQTAALGGMWGFFFADAPVTDYASAKRSDVPRFRRFFHMCLEDGVYLAPSPYEAAFVSTAHDEHLVARTLDVFESALR